LFADERSKIMTSNLSPDAKTKIPLWTWLVPVLALAALLVARTVGVGTGIALLCCAALMGAVFVAVHHAEVVAHKVGEPFGTLVLALAVTAIESSLILSMMVAGGQDMAVLARDSLYAAVMIICTGVVGLCILAGGLAHREQTFRVEGAGAGLAALIVLASLTLVYRHLARAHQAALTADPNSRSWRSVRRRFGRSSSLFKLCDIVIISFPRIPPVQRRTHSPRQHGRPG
jgi:Ca2+/H+ antiporter